MEERQLRVFSQVRSVSVVNLSLRGFGTPFKNELLEMDNSMQNFKATFAESSDLISKEYSLVSKIRFGEVRNRIKQAAERVDSSRKACRLALLHGQAEVARIVAEKQRMKELKQERTVLRSQLSSLWKHAATQRQIATETEQQLINLRIELIVTSSGLILC